MPLDYDAYDALLHHIYRTSHGSVWHVPSAGEQATSGGVCLRVDQTQFRLFPYEDARLIPFEAAVKQLNPIVAVKTRTAAVHAALNIVDKDAIAMHIDDDTRIQILDSIEDLPRADKEQCGAFIRSDMSLVIWTDNLDYIIPLIQEFEEKLVKLVWRSRTTARPPMPSRDGSAAATPNPASSQDSIANDEKKGELPSQTVDNAETNELPAIISHKDSRSYKKFQFGWRRTKKALATPSNDLEVASPSEAAKARPIRLLAPAYAGLATGLSIYFIGSGIEILLVESILDGTFTRWALLVVTPFVFCVSIFFALQLIGNLSFIIGPVAQYHENSRYYSAVRPPPDPETDRDLPHITIQMPVYKESLTGVIAPSVESLKRAMQTYARQGGTSKIFINDDGLQLLPEPERNARIEFYANHGIGWVARPAHTGIKKIKGDDGEVKEEGFVRAGRFKKASNMNYGLRLSLRMERCLLELREEKNPIGVLASRTEADQPDREPAAITASGETDSGGDADEDDESVLERQALQMAIDETFEEAGQLEGRRPWASLAQANSLRIGPIILLVDSDTIVPADCLRDAARELGASPEVAIIQHESDVMQVAWHYFENGIAYFTRRINRCISMACANGEVAPFVGHNAFLRWSALQDVAFVEERGEKKNGEFEISKSDGSGRGEVKIWSENNVSEDFDMALRLQLKGYIIRWASYSSGGFKEGVSLTCDDELNRWQKYAYGCNELLFNPLVQWWRRGPVTKKIHTFIWSNAPLHYKLSMLSYMFSYYGLAAAVTLSVLNYLLLGFAVSVDDFFDHSWEIWLACTVVFTIAGNVGFILLEYRLGMRSLLDGIYTNLLWLPFFFFFFGGLSIHLTQALLAHLFSYNITWGATKKEVERSNFFLEIPKIWQRFRLSFIVSFICFAGVIILSTSLVPVEWRVNGTEWAVIFPVVLTAGCHTLYPIVLNPWLMIFSY